MSDKYKYSAELMNYLGLNKNITLTRKQLYNHSLAKCEKAYGNKYRIPVGLYVLLITDKWLINNANNLESSTILIKSYELKQFIAKIVTESSDTDKYITVTSIYSDTPIKNIQVII